MTNSNTLFQPTDQKYGGNTNRFTVWTLGSSIYEDFYSAACLTSSVHDIKVHFSGIKLCGYNDCCCWQRRLQLLLYIQMELCSKTLKHWLEERNQAVTLPAGIILFLCSLLQMCVISSVYSVLLRIYGVYSFGA